MTPVRTALRNSCSVADRTTSGMPPRLTLPPRTWFFVAVVARNSARAVLRCFNRVFRPPPSACSGGPGLPGRRDTTTPRSRAHLATAGVPVIELQRAALGHHDPWVRRRCLALLDHHAADGSTPVLLARSATRWPPSGDRPPWAGVRALPKRRPVRRRRRAPVIETLERGLDPGARYKTLPILRRFANRHPAAMAALRRDRPRPAPVGSCPPRLPAGSAAESKRPATAAGSQGKGDGRPEEIVSRSVRAFHPVVPVWGSERRLSRRPRRMR